MGSKGEGHGLRNCPGHLLFGALLKAGDAHFQAFTALMLRRKVLSELIYSFVQSRFRRARVRKITFQLLHLLGMLNLFPARRNHHSIVAGERQ